MAILDQPLYGTEAKGKIKSTVTFFPRSANPLCTDEGDDRWFHLTPISYRRESASSPREEQKNKFRNGLLAWSILTPEEKAAWEEETTGLQTAFNAFMSDYLLTH